MASLATISTSRPETRPMPVTSPAPGASSSYMSQAASGDSSRNGEPGSSSRLDALADRQLALLAVALEVALAAAALACRVSCARSSATRLLHVGSRLPRELRRSAGSICVSRTIHQRRGSRL